MTRLKSTGLAAKFNIAGDNMKIQNLEAEIEHLTQQLKHQSGVVQLDLQLIDRDEEQPRKTFPTKSIEQRARSLELHGQKTPIIVIPQPDGRYKLFDGELRVLGAKYLNWTQIDGVILPPERANLESIDIFRGQVITGIQSQLLHHLDLADAIVKLSLSDPILARLEPEKDLPKILNTVLTRLKNHKLLDQLSDLVCRSRQEISEWLSATPSIDRQEEVALLQMLLELQLNPKTVSNHVLPMLSLPSELKEAVRTHDLESSKVLAIAKLTAERLGVTAAEAISIRRQLVDKTIKDKLSLPMVLAECQKCLPQSAASHPRTKKILKSIDSIDFEGLADSEIKAVQKSLKEKLTQIQQLLKKS